MSTNHGTDLVWLKHIRTCIEEVKEYTGNQKERFEGSRLVQRAVERVLQTLAESTQRLTPTLKATEPEIPWAKIAGFRNVLTHRYLKIDPAIVWGVVENDLPGLAAAIERMTERTKEIRAGEPIDEEIAQRDSDADSQTHKTRTPAE